MRSPDEPWMGQMSLPRELSVRDGRLYQTPTREFDALRCNKTVHEKVNFTGTISLEGVSGRRIDMELTLRRGDAQALYQKFAVRFAQNTNITPL